MSYANGEERDPRYFLESESYVYTLDDESTTTAQSIGPALLPGVRRVVENAQLYNEETGARHAIEFLDGNDATVRGYVSAKDGEPGFADVGVSGYVTPAAQASATIAALRPQYRLTAAPAAGQLVLVVKCRLESLRQYPGSFTA